MIVRTSDFVYQAESYSRLVEHARRTRLLIYQHILTNPSKPSYAIIHYGHPRIPQSLEYITETLSEDPDLHALLSTLNLAEANIINHGFFSTRTTLKGKHIDPRDHDPPEYSDNRKKQRKHIRELLEADSLENAFSRLGDLNVTSALKNAYVPVMEIFYTLNRLGVMSDEMRPWDIDNAHETTLGDLHNDFVALDQRSPRYKAYVQKFIPFLERLRAAEVSRGLWIVSEDSPRRYNISSLPFLEDPSFLLRVVLRLRELLFERVFRRLKHLLFVEGVDYESAVKECFRRTSPGDSYDMFTLKQLEDLLESLGNNIFQRQDIGIYGGSSTLLIDAREAAEYIQSQDSVISYRIPTNSLLHHPAYNDYIEVLKLLYTYVLDDQVNYKKQGHQAFRGDERIIYALHFGDPEAVYRQAHDIARAILDEERKIAANVADSDELLLIDEGHHFNDPAESVDVFEGDDYWSISIPMPDEITLRAARVLPPSYQKSPKRDLDPIEILRNDQEMRRTQAVIDERKAEEEAEKKAIEDMIEADRLWWKRNIVALNTPIMNNIMRSSELERQYPGIDREDWGPRNQEEEDAKQQYLQIHSLPSNLTLRTDPYLRNPPPRDPAEELRNDIVSSTFDLNNPGNGPQYPVRRKLHDSYH